MISITPAMIKPTSILMIDDDILLVKGLKSLLQKHIKSKFVYNGFFTKEYEQELYYNYQSILSFNKLSLKEIYNYFDNFNIFSVIIIDYNMLPEDGLKIIREINNPFVQKIMISNLMSDKEAMNALNEGLINFYLCKMDNNFIEDLSKAIIISQQNFFVSISKLITNYSDIDNLLLEKGSKKIFEDIKTKYNLEYYETTENFRNFKFFNDKKIKQLTLEFTSEIELNELLNSYQAESAAKDVLEVIKTGTMIPHFPNGHIQNGEHWLKYLKPAKSFIDKQKYFYTINNEE